MASDEVREALVNWIEQALSPMGRLPEGTEPAAWIADHFTSWWRVNAESSISDAERALSYVREELLRLGGWEKFGEALHELTHAEDALGDIRMAMRLFHKSNE